MLAKFPERPVLVELSPRVGGAGDELDATQTAYAATVRALLPLRVDVAYIDHVSDRRIRQTQQRVELFEERSGGPIATQLFPDGSASIQRLLGASQVKAMRDLEGRLASVAGRWPEAAAEQAVIAGLRAQYEAALAAREAGAQASADRRAVRNAAKERFLTVYVEAMARVQAEFPRDRPTQELFFDDVRTRSRIDAADEDSASEPPAASE